MIFQWQGISETGERVQGIAEAISNEEFLKTFQANTITLLRFKKKSQRLAAKHHKISLKQITAFTHELYTLLQAGIVISDALIIIADGCIHKNLREMLLTIKIKLEQGQSLSQALYFFPDVFDSIYCGSIAAGEHAGKLNAVLFELYEYQANILQMHKKIHKAIFYPMVILFISLTITWGLLFFVMPQFETVFENFHGSLPLLTRIVLNCSHALHQYHWLFIFTLLFSGFAIRIIFQYRGLKNFIKAVIIKIPLLRKIFAAAAIYRWSQILATTLEAGIPLVDALQLSTTVLNIPMYHRAIINTIHSISMGSSFYQSLNEHSLFPKKITRLIALGEQTGLLALMLRRICEIYKEDLNRWLERASQLLEPLIMVILSSFIALLIIAMYIPIFKMGQLL